VRILFFYHSLYSDWNHGNAHFLRGVAWELGSRGHNVEIYEPEDSWSFNHLIAEQGDRVIAEFRRVYPSLRGIRYDPLTLDLERVLDGASLVIVHEWNSVEFIRKIGHYRQKLGGFRAFFHDTHHRSVTEPHTLAQYELSTYDAVLAYGESIRRVYLAHGWAQRVFTWHEAADTRIFHPLPAQRKDSDVVWIGNWGDEERSAEVREFFIKPVCELGLRARAFGVRYPDGALQELAAAGIEYGGWLPNFRVPQVFATSRVTLHIPRAPYAHRLPGIPTIRPFEALACGIPLISAPWDDAEGLFRPGEDFLVAHDQQEMAMHLRSILSSPELAAKLASSGLERIHSRHTCRHRVDELLQIYNALHLEQYQPPAQFSYPQNQEMLT